MLEQPQITAQRWGVADFWTYIGVEHIRSSNPGYCYLQAGFEHYRWGQSAKLGKMRLLCMSQTRVREVCYADTP